MSKLNLLTKKFNKYAFSIKDFIENSFLNLKNFISNIRKGKLSNNNRVFLAIVSFVLITLFYFLIPTFYNKSLLQSKIKDEILKKYNIDIKFNKKIRYQLFPKPHFSANNLLILHEKKNIAEVKNIKFFISTNFFRVNQIELKNLIIKKADFNIYKNNLSFFKELLKIEPNENKIIIKDSKIFFKNNFDEVLFINKIDNSKFFYDSNKLENILTSKNEIFNVPYKLIVRNDKFNKKIYSKFNAKKIRLNLDNEIDYNDDETLIGILDVLLVNKSDSINYKIKENSLSFISEKRNNFYEGLIDFKPFYLSTKFSYDGLSSKNILNDDSFLFDLIRSDIFNNPNLNINASVNVKDITNIDELNNLKLKFNIEQGNIIATDSSIMWKDDFKIILKDSLLSHHQGDINLTGRILIDFKDVDDFYTSFQVKKNSRKKIDKIVFDFDYNLNQKKLNFNNIKINNISNSDLDKFIYDFNVKDKNLFNKITFKNFVSSFFEAYSG